MLQAQRLSLEALLIKLNFNFINNKILTLISIVMILVITGSFVFAQSSKTQLVCREKAKESAKTTYSNCMAEVKEAELEKIRDDYKNKMDQLKNYYDKKIKTLSPSEASDESREPRLKRKSLQPLKSIQTSTHTKVLPKGQPKKIITADENTSINQNSVKDIAPNHPTENPIVLYNDKEENETQQHPPTTVIEEIPAPEEVHNNTLDEDFR
jgi:hypothetical protein